jgi:hypothetical protein
MMMADLFMKSDAVISECGRYRYRLTRKWADGPTMAFVMLNPSTADASLDDPTIGRCIGFAKREGCGGLLVTNLFAWRATDPKELSRQPFPIGGDWRYHIEVALAVDGPVVCGWGSQKGIDAQVATFKQIAKEEGRSLLCFVKNKDGNPKHPLYVKGDQPLIAY